MLLYKLDQLLVPEVVKHAISRHDHHISSLQLHIVQHSILSGVRVGVMLWGCQLEGHVEFMLLRLQQISVVSPRCDFALLFLQRYRQRYRFRGVAGTGSMAPCWDVVLQQYKERSLRGSNHSRKGMLHYAAVPSAVGCSPWALLGDWTCG